MFQQENMIERKATKGGNAWAIITWFLLCMNETGYKNLMKLVSIGYLDGFYYKPRVDKALLKKYNEGLIATSACLAGEVTRFAAQGDYENCKKAAIEYTEIFPDRFYIELQNHNIPEELASHDILKKVSKELSIPLVATNDNHYCMEDHWEGTMCYFVWELAKIVMTPIAIDMNHVSFTLNRQMKCIIYSRILQKRLKIRCE